MPFHHPAFRLRLGLSLKSPFLLFKKLTLHVINTAPPLYSWMSFILYVSQGAKITEALTVVRAIASAI